MSAEQETPFDSIEGTYEYIDLLVNTIEEVRGDIDTEIARAGAEEANRRRRRRSSSPTTSSSWRPTSPAAGES